MESSFTDSENTGIQPADNYPEKPIFLAETQNTLPKTLLSLLLFMVAFYFVFNRDLKMLLLLVLVVFIHEMGHFLMMKYYKYTDVKMFFLPLFGAFVSGEKHDVPQSQRAFVLLAGPVPGIAIGTILIALSMLNSNQQLIYAGTIFIFINLFNLLPVTPLDGGHLLSTLFFHAKERVQMVFSVISAVLLAAYALFAGEYFLLIAPFFIISRIFYQSKLNKAKAALAIRSVEYDKPFDQLTNREYWLIREEVITHSGTFNDVHPKEYVVSPREKQIADIIKSFSQNKVIPDLKTGGKVGIVLSWIFFFLAPFIVFILLLVMREAHHDLF